jgi:Spy/CpxP family protein refolding chaperone
MFGFLIGTACLIGLVAVLRRGHRWHGHGCGGGRGRHFGPMYMLFDTLDTTPGQEKEIKNAVDEFVERARDARRDIWRSRSDLADALRSDDLDRARIEELLARHQAHFSDLGSRAADALGSIHSVLDDRQRRRLADLIESGPGWRFARHGGPYRSAC